jgi:L-lactate dehydrogenase
MSLLHSDIFILVASNPVDLYVQSFQQYFSDVPTNRIFGIGTTMATIRFNTWLAQMSNLKQATVSGAYCIGNQVHPVIVWNHAKVNDTAISTIPSLVSHRSSLETLVSGHRHKLICERKGQAWYGLSAIITRLCAELLSNNRKGKGKVEEKEEKTWVLSTYVPHYDTCISWPVKLNCDGIYKLIDVPLTPSEFAQMMAVVKCNILDFDKSS